MTVEVVPHEPNWSAQFEWERRRLEGVLVSRLTGPVEHIGSTAVPGLPAKPILDMIGGVHHLDLARSAIEPLAELGYVYTEHRPSALYFYRARPGQNFLDDATHTHHLHLTQPGSDIWQERLAFRDALRADPELARRYSDLKQGLAQIYRDDPIAYTEGKREFVSEVLAGAGIALQTNFDTLQL
ncbi:GrpB domain, predicted nucleotidyltransferase, UPF0157 family [Frankineae bacterium MT45]|nr:GrpB domain, predicted nucleotidyltransferase, UPF0157 family [Frankineae bacterium MT45]